MKTQYTSGTKVSSLWLNTINGRQLRFIHPPNTPVNVMNDGEYWQLSLSDINIGDFDGRYVTTNTTQNVSGQKTFTNGLRTTVTPSDPTDTVPLGFFNSAIANYVTLGTPQTIPADKTFGGAIHVREPQTGTEACNLRDSHNRFQQTAKIKISIQPSVITQGVTHQILNIFNPALCTIVYNKPAIMAGLVLQPHGNNGIFSFENRYGEAFDDPTILVKFDASLIGGSGYVYMSYNLDLSADLNTSNNTSNPADWFELDDDNLMRRTLQGNIRTVLVGDVANYSTTANPLRALSFVQVLEAPTSVYNPRSGQFNIGGAKEIILSF